MSENIANDKQRCDRAFVKIGLVHRNTSVFVVRAIDWLSEVHGDIHMEYHHLTGWGISTCYADDKWDEDSWISGDNGSLYTALIKAIEISEPAIGKPTPKSHGNAYNYKECAKYIEDKLGYSLYDTLGKHELLGVVELSNKDIEYRNWWHFLIDQRSILNFCETTIGSDLLEVGNDWQNEITEMFIYEFGNNAKYHVSW